MNELAQATLAQLVEGGAIRNYTLHGQPGGYTLSVRYGMSEGVLVAKRGGPRLFAKIETAFDLLRGWGVAQVEVRIADYLATPRAYRKGRPAALAEMDRVQGQGKKHAPAVPAKRSRTKPSAKAQLPLPGVVRGRTRLLNEQRTPGSGGSDARGEGACASISSPVDGQPTSTNRELVYRVAKPRSTRRAGPEPKRRVVG